MMNEHQMQLIDALSDMRITVEGMLTLYDEEAAPLYDMAKKPNSTRLPLPSMPLAKLSLPCAKASCSWKPLATPKLPRRRKQKHLLLLPLVQPDSPHGFPGFPAWSRCKTPLRPFFLQEDI
ncbi:MAG: hypothetical protein IKB78_07415 [Clostridia bacterium]|nr:hypothetical protein [Clostridia bacterium]